MIYFDNAATSYPKPLVVYKAHINSLREYGANPGRGGYDMSLKTAEKVYETRERAAQFFGAPSAENVVFTQNCTHAINYVLKGLLKKGDHVVISDMEHNAVTRPLYYMQKNDGIQYTVAKNESMGGEDFARKYIESFKREIRSNTKLFVASHASNVFGLKAPIEELGKLAKENGILLLVDAAQTAGVENINMQKQNIDFLCVPGHKGLYGPSGTGMLITSKGNLLTSIIQGGTGSGSLIYEQPDFMPDKFESGTINVSGSVALGEGIKYVSLNRDKIKEKEFGVIRYIYKKLSKMPNVILYTEAPFESGYVPIISFNIKGRSGENTALLLGKEGVAVRGGYHCSALAHRKFGTDKNGTCRISPGAFNNLEEAEKFMWKLKKIF